MRWYRWLYEFVMAGLAIAVVWLLMRPEEGWVQITNNVIWAVFAADYLIRLILSKDRRSFFWKNITDLIAIMPLVYLRALRAVRLVRLLRVVRSFSVLWRVTRDIRGVVKTNGLSYVLIATLCLILVGGMSITLLEPGIETIADGLWWSIVTTATVGYGDISPQTAGGRVVAVVLMLVGIGALGMTTGSIATYFIKPSQQFSGNCHIAHIQKQLDHWEELSSEEKCQLIEILKVVAVAETANSIPESQET